MNNIGTSVIGFLEKSLLTVVAVLTIIATLQELIAIFDARKVQLADLLLLFLYTEVPVSYTHLTLPTTEYV